MLRRQHGQFADNDVIGWRDTPKTLRFGRWPSIVSAIGEPYHIEEFAQSSDERKTSQSPRRSRAG